MSRAVLLPTPCDPFLIKYWLENFKKYYRDEVDKLYVHLNSTIEKEVIQYIQNLLDGDNKINYLYVDHQIEHGEAINQLLNMVTEDHVMLVEDDAYVFKSGIVNYAFKLIEENRYDCVGSKRGSCSIEIMNAAKNKWGLNYEGYGDQGCNFWPCYFFCKTETLKNTDRNFASRAWIKGEKVEALDYVIKDEEVAYSDTFVNTSLQLRAKGLNFGYFNQYHGSPNDISDYENGRNLWDGVAYWTHVGSLSSGVGGVLVNDIGVSLARRKIDLEPKEFNIPNAGVDEWARRLQWWKTFYDNSDDKLPEFKEEYIKAIRRLQVQAKVHDKLIIKRQLAYKELGL